MQTKILSKQVLYIILISCHPKGLEDFKSNFRNKMTDFDDIGGAEYTHTSHECVFSQNGTYNCRVCGKERVI